MKTIRATGHTNVTLQAAVDRAARAGGGLVKIPAGTYTMHDALHLRSGVHIVGERGTILKKVPSISSPLRPWVGYGQFEFQVKEPRKFKVGMGVCFGDKNAFGFYETVATITGRKGDTFFIDRPFAHDYAPPAGAWVRSTFSLISGNGITDASIRQLTLDGNPKEKSGLNGCRGGGLNLLNAQRVVIEDVEVTRYNGDAISFQGCTDIFVRHCHVHHNKGTGLHPGGGTVRYVMTDNVSEHNTGCGLFYCLRTTHSVCASNIFRHNGRAGVSIGERDTDHLLRYNQITDNAGPGIFFREPFLQSGDRLWIEGNELANNGGAAEIVLERALHQVCIIGNSIRPRTGPALFVGPGCTDIYFTGNTSSTVAGAKRAVRCKQPARFPAVGPLAAPLDAARHLNIAQLPRWRPD